MPVRYEKEITLSKCCLYGAEAALLLLEGLVEAQAFRKLQAHQISLKILDCHARLADLRLQNTRLEIRSLRPQKPVLDQSSEKLARRCAALRKDIRERVEHLNRAAEAAGRWLKKPETSRPNKKPNKRTNKKPNKKTAPGKAGHLAP